MLGSIQLLEHAAEYWIVILLVGSILVSSVITSNRRLNIKTYGEYIMILLVMTTGVGLLFLSLFGLLYGLLA